MSSPVTLPSPGTLLYRQVQAYLATDSDPTYGLVAALGGGANSIYPNAGGEPSGDPSVCPVPFLVVYPGNTHAQPDGTGRTWRVVVEAHDARDASEERIVALVWRVKVWLLGGVDSGGTRLAPFAAASDGLARYTGGLQFEEEAGPMPYDERWGTTVMQVTFAQYGTDRTSLRGRQG